MTRRVPFGPGPGSLITRDRFGHDLASPRSVDTVSTEPGQDHSATISLPKEFVTPVVQVKARRQQLGR